MRVLHVVPSVHPSRGGPSQSVPKLVATLSQLGVDARLAAAHSQGPDALGLELLRAPGEVPTPGSIRRLSAAIDSVDVVEIHSVWNLTTSIAAGLCRRARVPYVIAPRGMLDPFCVSRRRSAKRVYRTLVDRGTLSGASGLHFLSMDERDRALFVPELDHWRRVVSANGCDPLPDDLPSGVIASILGANVERPVLVSLGRIDEIKGLELQMEAIATFEPAERPELLFVGPDFGARARLERLATELRVSDRVHWFGPIYGPERFSILREASAVLITSLYDCCPNVARETVAAGGVLIATEGTGVGDLAAIGAARVVRRDAADLAREVRDIITDPATGRRVRLAARAAVATLSWEAVVEPLITLYERLTRAR